MLTSFMTVLEKGGILFFMILTGFIATKKNILTEDGSQQLTRILMYIVSPAIAVSSLQACMGEITPMNLLVFGGLSALAMVITLGMSYLVFRKKPAEQKKVLRFASIYSSCGFMGLPLAESLFGYKGLAYASIFTVVYSLFIWSHGVAQMRGRGAKVKIRNIILTPGIVGMLIGLPLFLLNIRLPNVVLSPIDSFASLNTPLAMLVIGCYIARIHFRDIFDSLTLYLLSAYRLLVIPIVTLLLLKLIPFEAEAITTIVVLAAAPSSANTVMFAIQYGGDAELGSRAVALTTIFSMLTMPLVAAISTVIPPLL